MGPNRADRDLALRGDFAERKPPVDRGGGFGLRRGQPVTLTQQGRVQPRDPVGIPDKSNEAAGQAARENAFCAGTRRNETM